MRKLLVTCLIALLAGTVSAQTTPRTSTQTGTTKTRLSPSPQTNTPATQSGNAKSTKTTAAPQTNVNANSAARTSQPAAQSRSTQTPNTSSTTTRNQTARPSATTSPNATGTTTARSVSSNTKKATEAKAVNPVRVKWMTLEEALEKSKTDKRKIFVDVYTDWCGWCKRMDSTTFINPTVAQYLNDHYYPVKFNAEQQKEIVFKEKTYQFKKNGAKGYHELAAEWLNNRLSYPTVVFLDENQGTIQPLQGYQDATKMEAVLNYFGTDSHKKTPWESYQKNFNGSGGQK
jgi:thioredoxin-related protein